MVLSIILIYNFAAIVFYSFTRDLHFLFKYISVFEKNDVPFSHESQIVPTTHFFHT